MASLNFRSLGLLLLVALVVLIILAVSNANAAQDGDDQGTGPIYLFQPPPVDPNACVVSTINPINTIFESDANTDPVSYYWDGGVQLLGNNEGKIVAVGREHVTRLNVDGTRDLTFGINGWTSISDTNGFIIGSNALAIDSQDRIYVASRSQQFPQNTAISRLLPDGTMDSSFSGDGVATFDNVLINGSSRGAYDVTIGPNGEIFGLQFDGYIFKMLDDGTLDTSFGMNGTGIVQINWARGASNSTFCYQMDIYQNYIYVGCYNQDDSIGAVRYSLDGIKDNSYGGGFDPYYTVQDNVSGCNDGGFKAYGCGVGPDGSFYMSGWVTDNKLTQCGDYAVFVAKFGPDGQRDTSFGNRNGVFIDRRDVIYNRSEDYAESYHQISFDQCTGNLLLPATMYTGDGPNASTDFGFVIQLTPQGIPISNSTDQFVQNASENYFWSGVTHPNGRYYVLGEYENNQSDFVAKIWDYQAPGYSYAKQMRPW